MPPARRRTAAAPAEDDRPSVVAGTEEESGAADVQPAPQQPAGQDEADDYAVIVEQQTDAGGYLVVGQYENRDSGMSRARREAADEGRTFRVRRADTGELLATYRYDPTTREVTRVEP